MLRATVRTRSGAGLLEDRPRPKGLSSPVARDESGRSPIRGTASFWRPHIGAAPLVGTQRQGHLSRRPNTRSTTASHSTCPSKRLLSRLASHSSHVLGRNLS